MSESPDFQPETPENSSKSPVPIILIVIGGLGCGCFGLIMLAILSAIALPSFLNQANKARESEARINIGSMNRGQQAYFLEKRQLTNSVADLGLNIPPETENYSYQIEIQPDGQSVKITAQAKEDTLRSYTGAVFIDKQGEEAKTYQGLCESDKPNTTPPAMPTLDLTSTPPSVECPPGSVSP